MARRPDAEEVVRFAARYPPGFVVPVFSNNVHEIRSYNRLAALARGSVLVMLQVCACVGVGAGLGTLSYPQGTSRRPLATHARHVLRMCVYLPRDIVQRCFSPTLPYPQADDIFPSTSTTCTCDYP